MTFTINGFTTKDVSDFAYKKGYRDVVGQDEEGKDIPNFVSKGQFCKDYLKMMFRNDIKAYRLEQSKKAVEEPTEPNITVV